MTNLDMAMALHTMTSAPKVRCLELTQVVRNLNHATKIYLEATGGLYTIDALQAWLNIAQPGCSAKAAANRTVMQRNPVKYGIKSEDLYTGDMRALGRARRTTTAQASQADVSAWLEEGTQAPLENK